MSRNKKYLVLLSLIVLAVIIAGICVFHNYYNAGKQETISDELYTETSKKLITEEPITKNDSGVEAISEDIAEDIAEEEPDPFAPIDIEEFSSGYVTTEDTTIETRYLIINIDKDIYVPDYFETMIELACDEMELASGLKFNEGPLADGKISVHVQKPSEKTFRKEYEIHPISHNGGKPYTEKQIKEMIKSIYSKTDDSGYVCYEVLEKRVNLSPINIMASDGGGTLIHEISHALYYQYQLPVWKIFSEGFAEETTIKVLRHLEDTDFFTSSKLGLSYQQEGNLFIFSPSLIKDEPLGYWFVNTPSELITPNDEHALGYNFMEYLDSLGGYTKWMDAYNNTNYYPDEMVSFLSAVYNTDVEAGFYEWLDGLEDIQEKTIRTGVNIPQKDKYTLYPNSGWDGMTTSFPPNDYTMTCADLTINLLEAKKYLVDIKHENEDDFYLDVPPLGDSTYIYLYDESGNYMRTLTSGGKMSLLNVGFARIFNASSMRQISIKGYPENDNEALGKEKEVTTSNSATVAPGNLMPLEGEGIEELRRMFKDSSAQNKALAELGYYKAAEYVYDGKEGYAFFIPASHMKYISADYNLPYSRYRESFMRSGFDVGEYPPTFINQYNESVYIAFTMKEEK